MFSIPCLKPDDPHAHPSPITASSSQLAYIGNVNGVYWDFPGGPVVKTLPFNAGGCNSICGQGARVPRSSQPEAQSIKQKQYYSKFNKDLNEWSTWKIKHKWYLLKS